MQTGADRLGELFEDHVLDSLEKQHRLSDFIGEGQWEFRMSAGVIRFDDGKLECSMQILGTQAEAGRSWMWAWANPGGNLPDDLLRDSLRVRELGEQRGIEPLTAPKLSIDLDADRANPEAKGDGERDEGELRDGHYFALIASGLCGADAHYRCPYDGGAAFVLLHDPRIAQRPGFDLPAFIAAFANIVSVYSFHHRRALMAYLRTRSIAFEEKGATVRFAIGGERALAVFDELGRLRHLATDTAARFAGLADAVAEAARQLRAAVPAPFATAEVRVNCMASCLGGMLARYTPPAGGEPVEFALYRSTAACGVFQEIGRTNAAEGAADPLRIELTVDAAGRYTARHGPFASIEAWRASTPKEISGTLESGSAMLPDPAPAAPQTLSVPASPPAVLPSSAAKPSWWKFWKR